MKIDFIQDKRLMKESGSADGSSNTSAQEDIALRRAQKGRTPEEQRRIAEQQKALQAAREAAAKNAGTVSGTEAAAQAAAQTRGTEASVENAANAARSEQDIIKDAYLKAVALFNQSAQGQMQALQSVEQMKAGFSGMLQVLGIVCKKLGAEEFGESCLDLAKDLKPNVVKVDPVALKAIEDYKRRIDMDPEVTQGIITAGRRSAARVASEAQGDVTGAANRGVDVARGVQQPTALDGVSGGSSGRTTSTGITVSSFDAALSSQTKGAHPGLSGTEVISLHDKFVKFAGQDGIANSPTEFASIIAAVRMTVHGKAGQDAVLSSIGLDKTGPAPAPR